MACLGRRSVRALALFTALSATGLAQRLDPAKWSISIEPKVAAPGSKIVARRLVKEAGVPVDYTMLRGIFMPAGVTKEQTDFYVDLFKKVRETPEWKKFMEDGAFNQTFMAGKEYVAWVAKAEALHRDLMQEAGFLAPKK